MRSTVHCLIAGCFTIAAASFASAQQPVTGVTGTVALEGTVEQEYDTAEALAVKTKDGVKHVFRAAKGLMVHGAKNEGDPLKSLREGQTVVVHYSVEGGNESAREIDRVGSDGLQVTEGTVIDINRAKKQITVRFDNHKTGTFRLTDRAAADVGKGIGSGDQSKVVIYYSDESGQKVAHYFKRAS